MRLVKKKKRIAPHFQIIGGKFPSKLEEILFLVFAQTEAHTGYRELKQEDEEENDHVEKERNLVMLGRSYHTNHRNN